MKRRASLALGGLVAALAVAQGCHRHAAPPLGLVVGTGAPITFPAADEAWSERMPLPSDTSMVTLAPDPALKVTEPKLDDKRHFEIKGQVLRIWFNENAVDVADITNAKKKVPALRITSPLTHASGAAPSGMCGG